VLGGRQPLAIINHRFIKGYHGDNTGGLVIFWVSMWQNGRRESSEIAQLFLKRERTAKLNSWTGNNLAPPGIDSA
jgi:hypothetical protein